MHSLFHRLPCSVDFNAMVHAGIPYTPAISYILYHLWMESPVSLLCSSQKLTLEVSPTASRQRSLGVFSGTVMFFHLFNFKDEKEKKEKRGSVAYILILIFVIQGMCRYKTRIINMMLKQSCSSVCVLFPIQVQSRKARSMARRIKPRTLSWP